MFFLLNEIPFLCQYWTYILCGCFSYLLARIYYGRIIHNQQQNQKLNEDELIDEDDYQPALPTNLEHIPLQYDQINETESLQRSTDFYNLLNKRRSVRHFSKKPIPLELIKNIIKAAGTSPSGAHTEPWTYVLIKTSAMKQQIRQIIELEEEINYKQRMGKKWTTDLIPLRTNWIKEYLTDAPYLILIFKQLYSVQDGVKRQHHYNEMSVCLSAGILLTAIHYAGLVSLTSTPLNCGGQIRKLLKRPNNEKLLLLLPVGYPAENCLVPDLQRKSFDDFCVQF